MYQTRFLMSESPDKDYGYVLINDEAYLSIGELVRYKITVDTTVLQSQGINSSELYMKFKNTETPLLRPFYLAGPYSFYVDIRPLNYNESERFEDEKIQFRSDVKPDETFKARLKLNAHSKVGDTNCYCWIIDVISQISVTPIPKLNFRMCIGTTAESIKKHDRPIDCIRGLECEKWDTRKLWDLPPRFPRKPVHLVIITHGIFSNVGCDMLYLKDRIERMANSIDDDINPNVVIRGYMGNIGRSANGIRSLGERLAKFIIKTVDDMRVKYNVDKISFIGHSLGGPVQSFAIHYISVERPDIFGESGLRPVNFIALASPFLGVIGDLPKVLSLALDIGALGKTGRDLNLKHSFFLPKKGIVNEDSTRRHVRYKNKPILELIPQAPALSVFQSFVNRTVYANVVHDGIVPLRTAALLYLDWNGLDDVQNIRKQQGDGQDPLEEDGERNKTSTGEIPEESMDKKSALQWLLPQPLVKKRYKQYFRTQTVGSNDVASSKAGSTNGSFNSQRFSPPPRASPLLAAASVLTAPLPSQEYITDPSIREDRIFHDKFYRPDELPPAHYTNRELIKKIIYPNDRIHRVQERIARYWQESMVWRKVLVELKPDSHNNIVVRRRFVNSYGWVVIDHLVEEHFGLEACKKYKDL